jgi:hypothetical protein
MSSYYAKRKVFSRVGWGKDVCTWNIQCERPSSYSIGEQKPRLASF